MILTVTLNQTALYNSSIYIGTCAETLKSDRFSGIWTYSSHYSLFPSCFNSLVFLLDYLATMAKKLTLASSR